MKKGLNTFVLVFCLAFHALAGNNDLSYDVKFHHALSGKALQMMITVRDDVHTNGWSGKVMYRGESMMTLAGGHDSAPDRWPRVMFGKGQITQPQQKGESR